MPQISLPFFPEDITLINSHIGFQKRAGIVYYFVGIMPVYQHPEADVQSFRFFTSQIVVNGNATPSGDCEGLWGKLNKRKTLGKEVSQ